ncbi:MAG: hypothetical protein IPG50_17525 [Myxococcales bacterium]|nr:hypothetical protein [Myxococcales bacterium]
MRFVTEEPDVTVTVDGVVIPSGDRSLPFDPGEHRIEASAPSRQTWASTFDVKSEPGQGSVTVPRLLAVSAPLVSTTTAGVAAPPPILAYTLFGASAVAAGFSVYYWVTTGAKESSREEAVASSNPSHRATADELRDQGLKAQTFAIVTTSVAAAAALGGVALVLLVRPGAERSAPKSAAFVPYVGLTGGGLRGQF